MLGIECSDDSERDFRLRCAAGPRQTGLPTAQIRSFARGPGPPHHGGSAARAATTGRVAGGDRCGGGWPVYLDASRTTRLGPRHTATTQLGAGVGAARRRGVSAGRAGGLGPARRRAPRRRRPVRSAALGADGDVRRGLAHRPPLQAHLHRQAAHRPGRRHGPPCTPSSLGARRRRRLQRPAPLPVPGASRLRSPRRPPRAEGPPPKILFLVQRPGAEADPDLTQSSPLSAI